MLKQCTKFMLKTWYLQIIYNIDYLIQFVKQMLKIMKHNQLEKELLWWLDRKILMWNSYNLINWQVDINFKLENTKKLFKWILQLTNYFKIEL